MPCALRRVSGFMSPSGVPCISSTVRANIYPALAQCAAGCEGPFALSGNGCICEVPSFWWTSATQVTSPCVAVGYLPDAVSLSKQLTQLGVDIAAVTTQVQALAATVSSQQTLTEGIAALQTSTSSVATSVHAGFAALVNTLDLQSNETALALRGTRTWELNTTNKLDALAKMLGGHNASAAQQMFNLSQDVSGLASDVKNQYLDVVDTLNHAFGTAPSDPPAPSGETQSFCPGFFLAGACWAITDTSLVRCATMDSFPVQSVTPGILSSEPIGCSSSSAPAAGIAYASASKLRSVAVPDGTQSSFCFQSGRTTLCLPPSASLTMLIATSDPAQSSLTPKPAVVGGGSRWYLIL